jgi:hypothetical protein
MTLRSLRPLAVLLAAACSGSDKDTAAPETPPCTTNLTWDNFGKGFVETWCSACHSQSVQGDWRQCSPGWDGAPPLNFDTLEEVRAWASVMDDKVSGRVAGPPPVDGECNGVPTAPACTCVDQSDMQMPPAGGLTQEDRDLFHEWASCGAPGEPSPLAACDPALDKPNTGSISIAAQAGADDLCGGGTNHVTGDLAITGGGAINLDCLCAVDGTISIAPGVTDASFADLATAGSLVADGAVDLASLSAPNLETLATGDLVLRGDDGLTSVDLTHLTYVSVGSATFEDLPAIQDLPLVQLAWVGGDFTFRNVSAVTANLARLYQVGGDLSITDNAFLISDNPFRTGFLTALHSVGGAIDFSRNLAFPVIELGSQHVIELGGPVTIADNPSLTVVDAFDTYGEYKPDDPDATPPVLFPISITITGNASLTEIEVFKALQTADTIVVSDNPSLLAIGDQAFTSLLFTSGGITIANNPNLAAMLGFAQLQSSGALALDGDGVPAWDGFGQLTVVHGDLSMSGNPSAAQILGFGDLASVEGDFVLDANPALTAITGLDSLVSVDGDLVVTNNGLLPTSDAAALAAGVSVDGTVVIQNNAP